jgi:hypothetical protein
MYNYFEGSQIPVTKRCKHYRVVHTRSTNVHNLRWERIQHAADTRGTTARVTSKDCMTATQAHKLCAFERRKWGSCSLSLSPPGPKPAPQDMPQPTPFTDVIAKTLSPSRKRCLVSPGTSKKRDKLSRTETPYPTPSRAAWKPKKKKKKSYPCNRSSPIGLCDVDSNFF